jgi:hypothetical protein
VTSGTAYYLRLLAYRQTALPAVGAYLALLAVIYTGDAGAPVPAATVTSAALMPIGALVFRATAGAESLPFADVTLVVMGGLRRRQLARLLAALVVMTLLSAIATIWAATANPHHYPASTVAIIVGMHLSQSLAGVGLGCLLAAPLPVAPGASAVALAGVVTASLLIPWLPPLNPLLRTLDHGPTPSALTIAAVLAQAAALGLILALTALPVARRA